MCMVLGMLPVSVVAVGDDTGSYNIWVNGVEVTEVNCTYIPTDGTFPDPEQTGHVSYDPETNTLTLNNAKVATSYSWTESSDNNKAGIYAEGDLNILLVGTNIVTKQDNDNGYSCAVYIKGKLTIAGDGTLNAYGGDITNSTNRFISSGIFARDNITINSGTINASAGETHISVSTSGGAYGVGIYSDGLLTINDGTVTAFGGDAGYQSNGIRVNGCTINGGSLTATGGTVNGTNQAYSFGIHLDGGELIVTGGSVTATGGGVSSASGSPVSSGIFGACNLSSGTLTATGKTFAMGSAPVYGAGYSVTTNTDAVPGAGDYNAGSISSYKYIRFKPTTEYDLWVGNARVNSVKMSGEGWSYTPAAEGTAQILTLNGADIKTAYEDSNYIYGLYAIGDLNLVLNGENTVDGQSKNEYGSCGVGIVGDLNISGNGSLTASGGRLSNTSNKFSYGMNIGGSLNILGSVELNLKGGNASADGNAGTKSIGINTEGGFVVENGNSVTATANSAAGDNYGMRSPGGITINGGTVIAKVDSGAAMSGAPAYGEGYTPTVTASTNSNGSPPETYDPADIGNYKYLKFESATVPASISTKAISGIEIPVTGGAPVSSISDTSEYISTVTWSPNDNPFKANTVYTATITVTPKAGYTLTGVPANFFTVAGATATNAANSGVITAVFPVTDEDIPAVTYTITLDPNGGDALTPPTLTTGADGKLSSLPTPSRSNYSFNGWFTAANGGTKADSDTTFTANTTIYAQWTYSGGSGGSGGGGNTPPSAPETTPVTGQVIDGKTGAVVQGLTAQARTAANGTAVVQVKAQEAIIFTQQNGTKNPLTDVSKLGFTPQTNNDAKISITPSGTIEMSNLASNTQSKFAILLDLGSNRNITIGFMEVKVGSNGSVTSISSTLIDPYGTITEAATGEKIIGAHVTLYYADTERNKQNGNAAHTRVDLPALDDFKPNNNKNPQNSDNEGFYAFMVFPTADYYLVATKEGYETYKSMTISVEQEIVKWDFKMNKPLKGLYRLAGDNRVETALAIAKANYTSKLENVILTTADNYPDALAGSVLANKLNAPILLMDTSASEQNKVIDYLKSNLKPSGTVYILGGTGAVGPEVESKVKGAGYTKITRISGNDRSDTGLKIVEQLQVPTGRPIILVNEESYADALSISSSAAAGEMPILLVGKDKISDAVRQKIAEINPIKVYLIGGEGVLSTQVANQVASITGLSANNIIRLGGIDRYATSLAVAKHFNLSGQSATLATGKNFPDALAGGVFAANYNAPILLVNEAIGNDTISYLKTRSMVGGVIFGGDGVLGKNIEQELSQLIRK